MSVDMDRTLVLMRHAKSAWPEGVDDVDRPLNDRGRRDAPAAGQWLMQHVGIPDYIVLSPARRTRETVDHVVATWAGAPVTTDIQIHDALYEARASTLAAVIAGLPVRAQCVVMVGHNPGLADVVSSWPLTSSAQAQDVLATKFPTSAMAVVQVSGTWIRPTSAHLSQIVIPRG